MMHDPSQHKHDPAHPNDLLGRPIQVGDLVAWPCMAGRSARMAVGKIERINFKVKSQTTYTYVPCPQHAATKYTLTLEPLQSSSWRHRDTRTVTIQNIENVLKLETPPWGLIDKLVG